VPFPDKHGKGTLLASTEPPTIPGSSNLLPDSKVAKRYDVTLRTIDRWDDDPKLGFPKPVRIKRRKYRFEVELDEFDARRAAERDACLDQRKQSDEAQPRTGLSV
jgi:hypothetical protein